MVVIDRRMVAELAPALVGIRVDLGVVRIPPEQGRRSTHVHIIYQVGQAGPGSRPAIGDGERTTMSSMVTPGWSTGNPISERLLNLVLSGDPVTSC
jgi:hypothetical protein